MKRVKNGVKPINMKTKINLHYQMINLYFTPKTLQYRKWHLCESVFFCHFDLSMKNCLIGVNNGSKI